MKNFTKKYQKHIRKNPSISQRKRRKKFSFCCDFWKRFTTPQERVLWDNFAVGRETGFNAFLRINIVLTYNDMPIMSTPPE